MKDLKNKYKVEVTANLIGSHKHPKCLSYQSNHPLDPVEYDCEYESKIDCGECKYSGQGGRKDPEAKRNQQ